MPFQHMPHEYPDLHALLLASGMCFEAKCGISKGQLK